MSVPEIILGVLLILSSIVLIFVVLLQTDRSAELSGAIMGGNESSFLGKHKGRTVGARLAKWTKGIAVVFFILILTANIISWL